MSTVEPVKHGFLRTGRRRLDSDTSSSRDLVLANGKVIHADALDNRSVNQRFTVEHLEEEVYGEPHLCHADGTLASALDLKTFDTVSEDVHLEMRRNVARIQVKVNCERVRPVRATYNLWMKKSVVITRHIDIDLQCTAEGRRLYDQVTSDQKNRFRFDVHGGYECDGGSTLRGRRAALVYSELMGMAEDMYESDMDESLCQRRPSLLLSLQSGSARKLRELDRTQPRSRWRHRRTDSDTSNDLLY